MRLLIIFLFLCFNLNGQEGKLTIKADGGKVSYSLKRCLKRGKLIKTDKGVLFKVVVWKGYAPWSKGYSLIVRSVGDGRYSNNVQIKNLTDNIIIDFDNESSLY